MVAVAVAVADVVVVVVGVVVVVAINTNKHNGGTMKKIVEEIEGEGLVKLLGKRVTLWCECYIYAGVLMGVNDNDVLLKDAMIVYETGQLNESGFKNAQALPCNWYVRVSKIESYGEMQ